VCTREGSDLISNPTSINFVKIFGESIIIALLTGEIPSESFLSRILFSLSDDFSLITGDFSSISRINL
jgi:hypothetical protein